ncbi:MAG TPA: PH domain-containing protein [Candidatus Saccharimonadales bacterium]|nr:PH domain-containing protein [Candidatus Saccharimonadales bacterium]
MNPDEQHAEPPPDVPPPTPQDEEIVDPRFPQGNALQVVIKRHPFGLVALYLEAAVGLGAALGLIFFLIPSLLTGDTRDNAIHWLTLFGLVAFTLTAIFLLIATFIYRQNRWVVTDDSISQNLQMGLFRRQTSELSMANIEDVTAEQTGLLATLFGFGTLKVETAGERSNFHFLYCPTPKRYSQIILDARERFITGRPEQANRANDTLNVPGEFPRG